MRVVHLLPHARTLGGTERTVIDLLRSPALSGVEQRVAFVQPGIVLGFDPAAVLAARGAAKTLPMSALRAILAYEPHVAHGWLLQGNLFGALVKRLRPQTALITSERNVGHKLTRPKRLLERLVAAAEDVATANSAAVRDAAVDRVPRRGRRFEVIAPGVAAPRLQGAPRPTSAVMVGRLEPVKDHETALRAWRTVVQRQPQATLTLVGEGPLRTRLEALAAELGVAGSVRFVGHADPAPHLHGAKLFLSTSRAEGFSRATMEAMATGLPAVCTPVGGVPELPPDSVCRVPVGDAAAVAAAVMRLLDDAGERARLRAAALQVAEAYGPERCHAAYARLYKGVTA
jgi:glycosyltransferase involved in cell wall biosynthesis